MNTNATVSSVAYVTGLSLDNQIKAAAQALVRGEDLLTSKVVKRLAQRTPQLQQPIRAVRECPEPPDFQQI